MKNIRYNQILKEVALQAGMINQTRKTQIEKQIFQTSQKLYNKEEDGYVLREKTGKVWITLGFKLRIFHPKSLGRAS